MSRVRRTTQCADCGEIPKSRYTDGQWKRQCSCGKESYNEAGIEAHGEEAKLLASKGFKLARSKDGNTYYEGPTGILITLFADGTFLPEDSFAEGDKSATTFEDYLNSLSSRAA